MCVAISGLVLRLRRARGVERAQLKWLVYAALLLGTGLILLEIAKAVERPPGPIHAVGSTLTDVMLLVGLLVAIGVAVLRYRLYDIDVVIRRTIVYSVLSATLGGAYLACVLVLRELSQPLAGESGLAVAVSTLAVACSVPPGADMGRGRGRPAVLPRPIRHGAHVECLRRAPAARASTRTPSAATCAP